MSIHSDFQIGLLVWWRLPNSRDKEIPAKVIGHTVKLVRIHVVCPSGLNYERLVKPGKLNMRNKDEEERPRNIDQD